MNPAHGRLTPPVGAQYDRTIDIVRRLDANSRKFGWSSGIARKMTRSERSCSTLPGFMTCSSMTEHHVATSHVRTPFPEILADPRRKLSRLMSHQGSWTTSSRETASLRFV